MDTQDGDGFVMLAAGGLMVGAMAVLGVLMLAGRLLTTGG